MASSWTPVEKAVGAGTARPRSRTSEGSHNVRGPCGAHVAGYVNGGARGGFRLGEADVGQLASCARWLYGNRSLVQWRVVSGARCLVFLVQEVAGSERRSAFLVHVSTLSCLPVTAADTVGAGRRRTRALAQWRAPSSSSPPECWHLCSSCSVHPPDQPYPRLKQSQERPCCNGSAVRAPRSVVYRSAAGREAAACSLLHISSAAPSCASLRTAAVGVRLPLLQHVCPS